MGTLRIHGTIDISQFWPKGSNDADTTKIKLTVGEDSFEYKEDGASSFKKTKVFEDAISKGQGSKPVITTSKKTGARTITVRLQGVDAPELHYKAAPLKRSADISDTEREKFNEINEERRQCLAESATVALANHLKQYQNEDGIIEAIYETSVDKPFEVIDTYGRFIGNIKVGKQHDINLWLVENGWGMPAFYTSMSADEINAFLAVWKKGKNKVGRVGKSISKDATKFDWKLLYRKPSEDIKFKLLEDKGKVLMPKIFRRQCSWFVAKKAGAIEKTTGFKAFLAKSPDQLVLLEDLLNNGIHSAIVYSLHDFVDTKNKVLKNPEQLVFKEKPGTLVNGKGKKVVSWS